MLFSGCEQDRWYDWKVMNQLWLEENKKNEGVIVSHTGLQYKVIYQGTEADRKPNSTSYVTVDYTGRLIDGTVFDDQVLSGYMTTFIQGWVEGLCKMNLNGDYISDALAAEVGGIGIAPGANINYESGCAVFEATHGTAPDIAGKNIVNPLSMILSAEMMLRYIGWNEAASLIRDAVSRAISTKCVTKDFYDLLQKERKRAKMLSTREFTDEIISFI